MARTVARFGSDYKKRGRSPSWTFATHGRKIREQCQYVQVTDREIWPNRSLILSQFRAAMGARVQKNPALITAAVAGAALSTVATIILMSLVLAATSAITLRLLSIPLICAGIAAAAYGGGFTVLAFSRNGSS